MAGKIIINPNTSIMVKGNDNSAVGDDNPLLVSFAAVTPMTWTKTAFSLNGASQTLLAANTLRRGLKISNPVGNSQVSYDLGGATVTLANGLPLLAGESDWYTFGDCPTGIVTVIGTNTQTLIVYEGT